MLGGLLGLVSLAWLWPLRLSTSRARLDPRLAELLRTVFPALQKGRVVGRVYLRGGARREVEALRLANLLLRTADGSPDRLASVVRRRRQRDFERGRLEFIDGWVLARTEAQLAALFRLT